MPYLKLSVLLPLFLVAMVSVIAQETPAEGEAIRGVIDRAEQYYKRGLVLTLEKKPAQAKREFNAAIDAILASGYDVKKYKYLNDYYLSLTEKIYQAEQRLHSAPAKEGQCALTLEESPELRGFKLGRSLAEIQKTFPRSTHAGILEYEGQFGLRLVSISRVAHSARLAASIPNEKLPDSWVERFKGVDRVDLKFLDGKLTSIEITYDSSTKWNNPLEFTAAIAEALGLPKKGWRGRVPTSLDCGGFMVETIGELATPQMTIKIRDLDGELVTRKYEAERKKREAFKP